LTGKGQGKDRQVVKKILWPPVIQVIDPRSFQNPWQCTQEYLSLDQIPFIWLLYWSITWLCMSSVQCFLQNISNARDIQTPRRELKIWHAAECSRNLRFFDTQWSSVLSVQYILSIKTKTKEKTEKGNHQHLYRLINTRYPNLSWSWFSLF